MMQTLLFLSLVLPGVSIQAHPTRSISSTIKADGSNVNQAIHEDTSPPDAPLSAEASKQMKHRSVVRKAVRRDSPELVELDTSLGSKATTQTNTLAETCCSTCGIPQDLSRRRRRRRRSGSLLLEVDGKGAIDENAGNEEKEEDKKSEAADAEASQPSGCIDPGIPATWCSDCYDQAYSQCSLVLGALGNAVTIAECIAHKACNSNLVCWSWRSNSANCEDNNLLLALDPAGMTEKYKCIDPSNQETCKGCYNKVSNVCTENLDPALEGDGARKDAVLLCITQQACNSPRVCKDWRLGNCNASIASAAMVKRSEVTVKSQRGHLDSAAAAKCGD